MRPSPIQPCFRPAVASLLIENWHFLGGMPRACAFNLDHIQTVAKSKLGALITTLPMVRMQEVRAALLFALGFR